MNDLLLTPGTLTTFTVEEAEDDIGDIEDWTGVIVKPDLLALRFKTNLCIKNNKRKNLQYENIYICITIVYIYIYISLLIKLDN